MATLKCGDYGCRREGTQVPTGLVIGEYEGFTPAEVEEARCEQAARALRCNVHVGAMKRQKWGTPQAYEPVANRADVRLLAEGHYARLAALKAAERAKNDAENRLNAERRFKEEWTGWGKDEYTVQNDQSEYRSEHAGVRNLRVSPAGSEKSRGWDTWEVTTEQTTRYEDLPHPVYVRINRTGSMSPNEARALAKALNLMAERVDAANALVMQNVEVE